MNFLMRKLLESKMKDVPIDQREMILDMIEKNPAFFESIAEEVKAKMAEGKDQMAATMEVMQKHQDELKNLAGK
jgi:hypothetical protein